MKRRDFLSSLGAITTALASASPSSALPASATTSPEAAARDLIIRKQQGTLALQFGYHAITWNGKDLQAIEEIAAGGFKGIQLRSNILPEYGDKPSALKEIVELDAVPDPGKTPKDSLAISRQYIERTLKLTV